MNIFQRKYKKATISFTKRMNLLKLPVADEDIIDAINGAVNMVNDVKIIDINLHSFKIISSVRQFCW